MPRVVAGPVDASRLQHVERGLQDLRRGAASIDLAARHRGAAMA